MGQLGIVEVQIVGGYGESSNERTCIAALVGGLAEGGRIGETPVVENVIQIQSLHLYFQSVEVFGIIGGNLVGKAGYLVYLVVVSGATVENVHSQFGTVKAEVKLRAALFLAFLSVEPVRVDSPSQEYPPPSKVGAYLVVRIGRETEPLAVIAHGVVFVIGEMVEHQGVIVPVGTDIGSVEVAEVEEFLQCFSEGIFIYDAVACDRTVLLVLRKQ